MFVGGNVALCVALGAPLVAATDAAANCSDCGDPGGDVEFSVLGLELWSVAVSIGALGFSVVIILVSCACCFCCRCSGRRRREPAVDPVVWGVQGGTEIEGDPHLDHAEINNVATSNFGGTAENVGSHSNFYAAPEVTVEPPPVEDGEEQTEITEEIYDDGTSVATTRPESIIYAEAQVQKEPAASKSDSEPIYNNIQGRNISEGPYYMKLISSTSDLREMYTTPSPRRLPKDNTEQWEPPKL